MIPKTVALKQLARLEAIPCPPPTDAGLRELCAKLQEVSRSEDHAKNTVSRLIEIPPMRSDGGCRWPTLAEITDTAWKVLDDSEKAFRKKCDDPLCFDGWRIVAIAGGNGSGATKCRVCSG